MGLPAVKFSSMLLCGERPAPMCTNISCWKRGDHAKIAPQPRGPTAVKTQLPIHRDDEHVVVKFRPRTSAHPPGHRHEPGHRNEPGYRNEPGHPDDPVAQARGGAAG